MQLSVFRIACLSIALCACTPQDLPPTQTGADAQTYFSYDDSDIAGLPAAQPGREEVSVAQLVAWDTRMVDIARRELLPPTTAARLFAAVSIGQRDAVLLGATRSGVDATGMMMACDVVPKACDSMRSLLQRDLHDVGLAEMIGKRMHQKNTAVDTASMPASGSGLWTSENPVTPEDATRTPWVRTAVFSFPPPPAVGSPEDLRQLQASRDALRAVTAASQQRVMYWMAVPGSDGAPALWMQKMDNLLLAHGATDVRAVMQLRASMTTAMSDALTASWKAKYQYLTQRPPQRDTTIAAMVTLPQSPSYPSDHAAASAAAAAVLSAAFPKEAAAIATHAQEAADSRVWAGADFPNDRDQGLAGGEAIGKAVLHNPVFSVTPVRP